MPAPGVPAKSLQTRSFDHFLVGNRHTTTRALEAQRRQISLTVFTTLHHARPQVESLPQVGKIDGYVVPQRADMRNRDRHKLVEVVRIAHVAMTVREDEGEDFGREAVDRWHIRVVGVVGWNNERNGVEVRRSRPVPPASVLVLFSTRELPVVRNGSRARAQREIFTILARVTRATAQIECSSGGTLLQSKSSR